MLVPVRLCCQERHSGPECSDGKVMCCLCYKRFKVQDLNELSDGHREDVCKTCAELEKKEIKRRKVSKGE